MNTSRHLEVHAAGVAAVGLLLTLIWATTSRGFFWPVQALLPLAATVAIHAWFVLLGEGRPRRDRFLGSEALAVHSGLAAVLWVYLFALWLVGDRGYFWPAWALLGLAAVLGIHAFTVAERSRAR